MVIRSMVCVGLMLPGVAFGAVHYANARVIDVQPLYETVTVNTPREVCREERYVVSTPERRPNGAAPFLGAVLGGVFGHAVADGRKDKQVATAAGALIGGAVGMNMANRQPVPATNRYETRQMCSLRDNITTEESLVGYNVRYRYQGETYMMRTDRHPGDTVRVRVDVTPEW